MHLILLSRPWWRKEGSKRIRHVSWEEWWRSPAAEIASNAHVCQSISFHSFVVEPGTFASPPFEAAEHAEFSCTAAGHVVAAFHKLDESSAAVAPLPACLSCSFQECVRFGVFRTVPSTVPFCVTCNADFGLAFSADTLLFAFSPLNILRPNPHPTFLRRAINPILRGIFLILPIPLLLPLIREKLVYCTKRDWIRGTAFRWHLLRVVEGEFKAAAQAGVTLAVPAFELFCAGRFYVVIKADYTRDTRALLACIS